jgi:hypothetical protein
MRDIYKNNVSEKKQRLIDEFQSHPAKVGEMVYVKIENFTGDDLKYVSQRESPDFPEHYRDCLVVKSVDDNGDVVCTSTHGSKFPYGNKINVKRSNYKRYDWKVGVNPMITFKVTQGNPTDVQTLIWRFERDSRNKYFEEYGIEGGIPEINNNPYVKDKDGNKFYYQRDLVWNLLDKQRLITSIYNRLYCGSIVTYSREYEECEAILKTGEKEVAWRDLIDGKQRIDAIFAFVNNEFPDSDGNYFNDLSLSSQMEFLNCQCFSFIELKHVSDEEILKYFVALNSYGSKQTDEHLDKVRSQII